MPLQLPFGPAAQRLDHISSNGRPLRDTFIFATAHNSYNQQTSESHGNYGWLGQDPRGTDASSPA